MTIALGKFTKDENDLFDIMDEEVLKRCLECNENGLIRCPNCCSS